MIKFVKGNILDSKAEAIINTVNTKGVMGKGIALQYKKLYPKMFKDYITACNQGEVVIGKMHIWHNQAMFNPQYIINFPTKNDWKHPSKIEYIQKGLEDLVKVIKKLNIKSISIPPLGCGNGGLDWNKVRQLIIKYLEVLSDIEIEVFEPLVSPIKIKEHQDKTVAMNPQRALYISLLSKYCVLGYELTLLEIHKLLFFLQELGEPLKLKYEKKHYGPYADNLRHMLIKFEGVYTSGFGDGSKNNPDTEITILQKAIEEANEYIAKNSHSMSESINRLKMVEEMIKGYESPFGLELLSSVYWVVKKENIDIDNKEKIIEFVKSWNSRKAKLMKTEYILKAIARLAYSLKHKDAVA